jgi:transposase
LADLAKARLPTKLPQLRKALTARFGEHHGYLLARVLSHVEALEADIAALSERITEMVEPWAGQLMILDSITGVGMRAAEVILAEIGPDMSRFPTAGHLASWAGRCPGQREPRRAAGLRDATQGFALAGRRAHRVRLGRGQDQGHLPVGLLPTDHATPGQGRRRSWR